MAEDGQQIGDVRIDPSDFDHPPEFEIKNDSPADSVRRQLQLKEIPKIGIICGSGLSTIGDSVRDPQVLPFEKIRGLPETTVKGHRGNLLFGYIGNQYVLCLQGRIHPYEHGMDTALCSLPIRLMHHLGVEIVILSNAAGGIDANYKVGDIMIIKDQIFLPGLCGFSPLVGHNDATFGPRFVSLHDAYDKKLRRLGQAVAQDQGIRCHEGMYTMTGGPHYETAAEIRFLQAVGGNAIGSSTCHEVAVARQCGMKVFGFSLITNKADPEEGEHDPVAHEKVYAAAKEAEAHACAFVIELVKRIEFN